MRRRMSPENRATSQALGGQNENSSGAPNRILTSTRRVNSECRWTSSVPRIAIGTTGAPEYSAGTPAAPQPVMRSFELSRA